MGMNIFEDLDLDRASELKYIKKFMIDKDLPDYNKMSKNRLFKELTFMSLLIDVEEVRKEITRVIVSYERCMASHCSLLNVLHFYHEFHTVLSKYDKDFDPFVQYKFYIIILTLLKKRFSRLNIRKDINKILTYGRSE